MRYEKKSVKSQCVVLKVQSFNKVFFNVFKVCIVKLKMDKDRKKILDRRAKGRAEATGKDKGKFTEETVAAAAAPMES